MSEKSLSLDLSKWLLAAIVVFAAFRTVASQSAPYLAPDKLTIKQTVLDYLGARIWLRRWLRLQTGKAICSFR